MENIEPTPEAPVVDPKPVTPSDKPQWTLKLGRKGKIWTLVIVIVIVLLALAYYFKGVFVVALVNNHPISRLSVIRMLEKQSGTDVVNRLINNQLIEQEAKKQKISVSQSDVDKAISSYKDQLTSQGTTLDDLLKQQNVTTAQFNDDVLLELQLEKLLGNKIAVTDDEVNQYITANKVTIQAGQDAQVKAQIREQLKQSKVNSAAPTYLADLRTKANIKIFVNY